MPCNQLVAISYFPLRPQNWQISILRSVGADWGGRPALSPGLVGTKVSPSATLGSAGVLQRVVTQPVKCTTLCCCLFVMFCLSIFSLPPQNWIAQHTWLNWNILKFFNSGSSELERNLPGSKCQCFLLLLSFYILVLPMTGGRPIPFFFDVFSAGFASLYT